MRNGAVPEALGRRPHLRDAEGGSGARGELDPSPTRIRVLAVDEASFKRRQDRGPVISAPELRRAIELVRRRDGAGLEAWGPPFPGRSERGWRSSTPTYGSPTTGWQRWPSQPPSGWPISSTSSATPPGPWARSAGPPAEGHPGVAQGALPGAVASGPYYASTDPAVAGRALIAWCHGGEGSGLAPFVRLAGTIRRWKPAILASFRDSGDERPQRGGDEQGPGH